MATNKFPKEIEAIRKLLADNPEGMSIKAISTLLGMNRNSVAKYLDMLQMQGKVAIRQYGSARIYTLANKLPAAALLTILRSNVLIIGPGLTIIDINNQFRELLQVPKNNIIGKTINQLPFFLESHPDLSRHIQEGLKGKESRISSMLMFQDSSLPCTITFSPVFFENGDSGVAVIADITTGTIYPSHQDTGADRSLVELDEIEYSCRFQPEGTLTYVNRAYSELLQKPTAELIGHEWRPMVPDSEFKKIKKCLSMLNPAHPVASLEFRAISPNGESRWQRWKFRGVFNHEGKISGYQGTGIDINEIKKLKEQVSKSADELERLIREHNAEIQELNKQIYTEISSREKADFQLQFTQFAMNNASYMIIWISPEARFVYMNKKARLVLGYSYRELIVKEFPDIIDGELLLPWEEIWETTRKHHQYTIETAIRTREGHKVPVEIVLNFLAFKDKEYCCCFVTDITGRKLAENALKMSEERFRYLVSSSPVTIYSCHPSGTYSSTFISENVRQNLGYLPQEFTEDPEFWLHAIHPDDISRVLDEMRHLFEHDHHILDYRFRHKNGEWRWVRDELRLIRNTDGSPHEIIGCLIDITKRKEAESALKDSEHKYRMLVENIPEKIFIKDASLAYVSCNEHYARDLGIAGNVIAGKTDFDFYPGDLAEKYRADDRRVMESGAAGRFEDRYIIQGKESWISTLKTPIRDDTGNITGILGIFHDITKRRQEDNDYRQKTLQQLQTSYEKLQKSEAGLLLHQTELEVQNEELRQTQHNLEMSRERYFELYDLAPAGYFTINENGLILTANLTAATMLGVERHHLENKPFTRYIIPDDQDIFYICRKELIRSRERQWCELRMLHNGGSPFNVQVIAVPAPVIERNGATISLMVIDIPACKPAGDFR